jgi:hypothetical protein
MSSISLSLKMLLGVGALAGVTLLACGEESPKGNDDDEKNEEEKDPKDGGKGRDSSVRRDAAVEYVTPGDECDPKQFGGLGGPCEDCDQAPCISQCVDGEYGECKSATDLVSGLRDGGLEGILGRDSSIGNPFGDASVTRTDGGVSVDLGGDAGKVNIPATACPDSVECSAGSTGLVQSVISQFTMGIPYCADPASGLPPSCTDNADCMTQGFKQAICLDSMFLGKFCVQTCQ